FLSKSDGKSSGGGNRALCPRPSSGTAGSDPVHGVEDVLVHHMDLQVVLLAQLVKLVGQASHFCCGVGDVHQHHHDKHVLQNGLGHLQHIHALLRADAGNLCQNTHHIFADHRDDRL